MIAAPIVVVSHRRSGTHLAIDTVRLNFPHFSALPMTLEQLLPNHSNHTNIDSFLSAVGDLKTPAIIKTHASPGFREFAQNQQIDRAARKILDTAKVIYVCRDGRDVMVSLYNYERHISAQTKKQSFSEFLNSNDPFYTAVQEFGGFDRITVWCEHVDRWLEYSDLLVLKYEDLLRSPLSSVHRIAAFLRIEKPAVIERARFTRKHMPQRILERLGVLSKRSTAVRPRRGVIGDWRQWFSASDLQHFDKLARPTMTRLGYSTETTENMSP